MHYRLLLPLLSAPLLSAALRAADADDEFSLAPGATSGPGGSSTATVHAWPLSAASATPLAKVVYGGGGGGGGATWQPLGDNNSEDGGDAEELVRVGLAETDGVAWRGTVTTRRLLRDGAVVLRLGPAGAGVWFVEVLPRSEVRPDDSTGGL